MRPGRGSDSRSIPIGNPSAPRGVDAEVRRFVLVILLALAFAPEAAAKCCALVAPVAPEGIAAGQEWRATIRVQGGREYWRTDRPPTVIAWTDKPRQLFSAEARPTAPSGIYEASVVFPEPGSWTYTVTFGGFASSASAPLRRVTVVPPTQTSFLPAALAAGALLLLGVSVALVRRPAACYVRAGSTASTTS